MSFVKIKGLLGDADCDETGTSDDEHEKKGDSFF